MKVKITIDTTSDLCVTYDVRPETYAGGDDPACCGTIWREDFGDWTEKVATGIAKSAAACLTDTHPTFERITKK